MERRVFVVAPPLIPMPATLLALAFCGLFALLISPPIAVDPPVVVTVVGTAVVV